MKLFRQVNYYIILYYNYIRIIYYLFKCVEITEIQNTMVIIIIILLYM